MLFRAEQSNQLWQGSCVSHCPVRVNLPTAVLQTCCASPCGHVRDHLAAGSHHSV